MQFRILGPLEVVAGGGERVDPAADLQRRLLLALLVSRGDPVSIDRLVDIVWATAPSLPQDPVGTLRTYVTRLRGVLEPDRVGAGAGLLVGASDRYRLQLDDHELDAQQFEADIAAATTVADDDPQEALDLVERGLARWRGPALDEVADEDWARPEAVRLDELCLTARELRYGCLLDLAQADTAVAELTRYVAEHPLRERPHGQLMLALHRSGRTVAATEVFRSFRERLADETGLDPSPELERVHQRLLSGHDPVPATEGRTAGVWNRLPEPRTSLHGRTQEVAAVLGRCSTAHLVTLTGVGGVGKTRLALEVARTARTHDQRVAFVDLSGTTDSDDLVATTLGALRLRAAAPGTGLDTLARVLRTDPTLLVLDNCEHVVDGVAWLVDRLSGECPDLTVLATSREVLGIDGEQVHRTSPLDAASAAELFMVRAAAVTPTDAAHQPHTRELIEEICYRLDGIPLAIELAAARTAHMTIATIAEHLQERFWLLTGSRRAVGRHQTLQATMDWSYDLIDEHLQAVLRATSVFRGDFTADALASVVAESSRETIDALGTLVACSLVEVDHDRPEARYRLLETVRLYAQDRLVAAGEAEARRQAHATHYVTRALDHPARITDFPAWAATTGDDRDLDNQVAALDWCDRTGDLADLGRLAARLLTVLGCGAFIDRDNRYLGREDVAAALHDRAERTLYLTASAANANYLGHYHDQYALAEAATRTATDSTTRATAAHYLANAATSFDPDQVPNVIADALQDLPATATTLRQELRLQEALGIVMQNRLEAAAEVLERITKEGNGFAAAEHMLVLHLLGYHDRALAIPRPGALGPAYAIWDHRHPLTRGLVALAHQERDEARQHLMEATARAQASPIPLINRDVLIGWAAYHHSTSPRHAATLLASFRGHVRTPAAFATYLHYRDVTRTNLPRQERRAILEHAATLDPSQLLDQQATRAPDTA